EAAGSQIVGIVGEGRVGVIVFFLSFTQIAVLVGQGLSVMVLIGLSQHAQFAVLLIAFQGGAAAVNGLQIRFAIGVAVQSCVNIQVGNGGVNGSLILFRQGIAGSLSSVRHGVSSLGAGLGRLQEVICPGSAGFLIGYLLVQGLGGVQAKHGSIAAVSGIEIVYSVHVEVVQFSIADLVIPYGQSHRILFPDTAGSDGLSDTDKNRHDQQQCHYHNKSGGVKAHFLCFLLSG